MELYEKIIHENEEKGFQLRLTISEFRDIEYLHIRKYFLSYEGEFLPSKDGISMPATISNVYALLDGMIEICSKEESIDSISTHLENKLKELNNGLQDSPTS
jgi:hypothetical protein